MDLTKKFEAWRHSVTPTKEDAESSKYHGISKEGVELAKKRAESILKSLDEEKHGTVMFLGGASEAIRTKSTARVFGEEAKRLAQEKNEILVLTEEDIDTRKGYTKIAQEITDKIKTNPDKKFLIDIPLFVKEFGMSPWTTKEGDYSPYTTAVLKKHSGDRVESIKDWIENKGKFGDLQGPNPTDLAERQIKGIERLRKFAGKYLDENRSLVIGAVGHSWNLDALAVYLANQGTVDLKGFEKVGSKMIGETESVKVKIVKEGGFLCYKGKEYPVEF